MHCESCGESYPNAKSVYCASCGTKRKVKSSAVKPKKSKQEANGADGLSIAISSLQTLPKPVRLSVFVGVPVLLLVILGASQVPGLLSPLSESEMPSYKNSFSASEIEEHSIGLCSELEDLLPSQETLTELAARVEQIDAVGTKDEGRKMLAFKAKTGWMSGSDLRTELAEQIDALIERELIEVAEDHQLLGINGSNRATLVEVWKVEFGDQAKANCAFDSRESAALRALGSYDSSVKGAVRLANSAPWYPNGYFDAGDGLAGKWTRDYVDCYGCSYWTMDVVSKNGCPSGVYVEMSILRDGVAVDWTNDTLASLSPGQRGKLEFRAYLSGSGSNYTGSISESSCY